MATHTGTIVLLADLDVGVVRSVGGEVKAGGAALAAVAGGAAKLFGRVLAGGADEQLQPSPWESSCQILEWIPGERLAALKYQIVRDALVVRRAARAHD